MFSRLMMYSDNLFIDYYQKNEIPQNSKTNFEIKKSEILKDSLEIKIKPYEDVSTLNLYVIIKSYVCSLIYIPSNFFIIIKNLNEDEFIAFNSFIDEFKNMSYYGFLNWFYTQLQKDWEYIKKDGEYSFLLTYPIKVFDLDNLKYLRPKFPWKSEILTPLNRIITDENSYKIVIEKQKKKIERQKKIIEKQKKKIKEQKKKIEK